MAVLTRMAIGWNPPSFSDLRRARLGRALALAVGLAFATGGAACSSSSSAPPDAGSDTPGSAPDAADAAPDNQPPAATCADGGTPTAAFSDDFSAGLSANWTVSQTIPDLFSVDATQGDLRLAKAGTNTSAALQSITVEFNLGALGVPVDGDFELALDLRDATLGPSGLDQVEFHANFADNSEFFDVYEHSADSFNLHVWTGKVNAPMPTDATSGTFRIVRVGSTITGSLDDTMIYTTTNSAPLSAVRILLQLQQMSNDPVSVTLDNFHLQTGCVP